VLRWNRVANGAEAVLNGRKVGENKPTGPYQVILPPAVLRSGENQIVLKIRGAAEWLGEAADHIGGLLRIRIDMLFRPRRQLAPESVECEADGR